ncbi:LytR/AlgR family response regulator transcription factor [Aureibacter tunicatorum]|uniref:DNA-binding LytR/AlgR family response regulator n=1 Tax=Aureibacter tunicatorum TaxID=866807 RepID=A0AAE3XKZ3_9BACT|nr:LytTR family DNA-binding domain-containing protein [Aureibacter tunicatorum]MDR6237914.1 DNA-binding LytR/AlgR family response regulator [Aureibacter tunicatorum]BDD02947.1 DNA-binding response regulator [Aureibacter tunicatorum]
MKILIIEDEALASKRLKRLIRKVVPKAEIMDTFESVEETVEFLSTKGISQPELIFMDIELSDAQSFEIFDQIELHTPIIFTTAYPDHALKAFKANTVDYLLKPVSEEALEIAVEKYKKHHIALNSPAISSNNKGREYKERFMVKYGEKLKSIPVDESVCFFTQDKVAFMRTDTGRNYVLDHNMAELEVLLDPNKYFRVSRQYIVSLAAINEVYTYSSSRLRVLVKSFEDEEVIVSRDRVGKFKEWMGA